MLKVKCNKKEFLYYVLLILFTLGIGYISLGKGFNFRICPGFGGDGTFGVMLVKSIQENGPLGIWFNSRIGAPETATLIDYPVIGNVMVLLLWIISWFVKSAPAILYTYLILTFTLDGVSMSLLLRKLNINLETSFVISVLFSTAPYHFYRYLGHSSLINYMFVPISIYLSLCIIGYIREDKKWKLIFCAILLGLGYGYYYAFGLVLMAIAYLIGLVKNEDKKEVFKKLWIIIMVLATVFVTFLPRIALTLLKGSNTEAGTRYWFEQEMYGLKIINLLLPVSYSRIEALRRLSNEYAASAPLVTENGSAFLGFIGSVGFLTLCAAFIISFLNRKRKDNKDWLLIDYLSFSTLAFILVGTVGGFGEIFNWAVTSQIRCWNRSSIVIMALSLLMIAILLNKVANKGKMVSFELCALVLMAGMFDQVYILNENWQGETWRAQVMYETYFDQLEEALPEKSMVYQLPYINFPEGGGSNKLSDYKHFVGYLFTDDLRWSYGSVRGRNQVSKTLYVDNGMSYLFLDGVKKAGFAAVYIDLDGYADEGAEILSFYNSLGIEPLISGDGKLYTYDISDLEILDDYLTKEFALVKSWADKYVPGMLGKNILEITEGLVSADKSALDQIYTWFLRDPVIADSSDSVFVKFLYRTFLGREADPDGYAGYVSTLKGGTSRRDVFEIFLTCPEFRNRQGFDDGYLTKEFALVKSWADKYVPGMPRKNILEIAEDLVSADKSALDQIYTWFLQDPAITDSSDSVFVEFLYRTILGRKADPNGYAEYVSTLEGGTSRKDVFEIFLTCPEFRNRQGFDD